MQLFSDKSNIVNLGVDLDVEPEMKDTFIIGAGFGRTGTSSMQIALAKLGWRSYHMREFFKNGSKAYDACIKVGNLKCALREQLKDYDPSFGNFDQIVLPKGMVSIYYLIYITWTGTAYEKICNISIRCVRLE